ncbi:MAG: hypothetical protein N4A35_09325 [Flavobacteriales bacterium]|jgi:hypothetical protein|nr:hypothetical protein [Flavobacteriales bacterium]
MNKSTIINLLSITALSGAVLFAGACKKSEEPEPTVVPKVKGCTDIDSPLYNADAEESDGSCTYARVTKYEITYHPEMDGSSNWDPTVYTDADLILRIKEQGTSNWSFESSTIEDQAHNVPAEWTAPSPLKLLNKTYEWELYDDDNGTADDFISSGTFNPITLADLDNNTITTVSGGSQLKIYFNLQ